EADLARYQAVGQRAGELEERVGSEAVFELRHDRRAAVVLTDDANRVEVLLQQDVCIRQAADGKRGAEDEGRGASSAEESEKAAFLGFAPHARAPDGEGIEQVSFCQISSPEDAR